MTSLFRVEDGKLVAAHGRPLAKESLIEDWVAANPALLGLDALIIGRQVPTAHGKFIDLLALGRSGDLIIIELKKDRTPREIVAQVLDYASWVRGLTTPEIYEIAERYCHERLTTAYLNKFDDRIPDRLNAAHSMLIVASELDPASKRIVEYLSEEYGVAINTAFFNVFEADGHEWVTTDFLLDQAAVEERSERKVQAPWSKFYFVNAGLGEVRAWEDMTKYGFIGADGGSFYSKRLDQLKEEDRIFAFQKGEGYIGFGVVKTPKVLASEFMTPDGPLFDQPLAQPGLKMNADNPEYASYLVGVDWLRTFDRKQAKWFKNAFANQNIVCKLRDQSTVDFLLKEFGVDPN